MAAPFLVPPRFETVTIAGSSNSVAVQTQATRSYEAEKHTCETANSEALYKNSKGCNLGGNSIHSAELSNGKVQEVRSFPTRNRKKLRCTAEGHSSQKADHGLMDLAERDAMGRDSQPHSNHWQIQACCYEVPRPQSWGCLCAKPPASEKAPK